MTFLNVLKCIILMVDNLLQVLPCHLRFGDNALNIYNFIIDGREQAKKKAVSFMAWVALKTHHFELFPISVILCLHN